MNRTVVRVLFAIGMAGGLSGCPPTSEDCINGVDDDENGLADCDDPVCADEPTCQVEDCTDGVDNDFDGETDCDDDECSADPVCVPPCGNDTIDPGEDCDGAALGGSDCTALGFAGGTLTCDATCSFDTSGCVTVTCGDAAVDPGEECDGGDLNGADCTTLGFSSGALVCSASCTFDTSACVPPACGDGTIDPTELCDDGNTVSGDGCRGDCLGNEICGDGLLDVTELCDDANTTGGDGCRGDCVGTEVCGDGLLDTAAGELCDDGNIVNGDGCRDDCTGTEACGDGLLDAAAGEVCDDGNLFGGDGCRADCLGTEVCGDGLLDFGAGETCDDGNTSAGDGCRADCLGNELCGDGLLDPATGEVCDDGNTVPSDGCDAVCQPGPTCGDGVIEAPEECDDGNAISGDLCDAMCMLETTCGDFIRGEPYELCDDGNTLTGDLCDAACQIETNDVEPNGDAMDALSNPYFPGLIGAITPAGDEDWVALDVMLGGAPSATLVARVLSLDGIGARECAGFVLDSELELVDTDGMTSLAFDDNSGQGDCSTILTTLFADGTYFLRVTSSVAGDPNGVFGYTLAVTIAPDVCGDGLYGLVEECDDGNTTSGDGCSDTCLVEYCGDGIINNVTEVCDDGNATGGDGCRDDCLGVEVCGDGLMDALLGEECDDGNTTGGDLCDSACQYEFNEMEPNDDPTAAPAYPGPVRGHISPVGDLDCFTVDVAADSDLIAETFDATGTECWFVDTIVELYDTTTGVLLTSDDDSGLGFCALLLTAVTPGSYAVCVRDFATMTPDYRLDVTVQPHVCGDGILATVEECDDGNTTPGDGCDAACSIEALGFSCFPGETLLQFPMSGLGLVFGASPVTITSDLVVGIPATVQRVIVGIDDLTHPFVTDVDAFLHSPAGTVVELFTDVGASGDDFLMTAVDDNCVVVDGPISAGSAPFTGCWSPEGLLSDFIGEPAAGTWTLELTDDFPGADDGTLDAWTLGLCVQ